MISSFSVTLMAAYLLCLISASAQQTDTTHVHDHNHGHTHQPRTTAHPHEHQHVHGHTHEHQHVHDHGVAHSHDEFTVAFVGNLATHNASFNSLPPIENCCTGFSDSKGLGFGFELGYTTPLTSDGLTITPHIGYVNMPVSFDSYSTEKAFTGGVVSGDALFRHTLDVTWSTVTFGARLEYPVLSSLYRGFGLDGYFYATGSFHQTETLEEPSNLVFETGTRVRLDKNGYVRGQNTVVFNATGSARIRLIEKQAGAVGVDIFGRYSLPLQPLFATQTWRGMYGNPPATFFIDSYSISMLTFGFGLVF